MSRSCDIIPEPVDEIVELDSSRQHWISHLTRIMAYVSFIVSSGERIYHMPLGSKWFKGKGIKHLEFCLHSVLSEESFDSKTPGIMWDSIVRRLKRDPSRKLNNANVSLLFRLDNMYLVKKGFTYGNWTVASGHLHVVQTSNAVMLCYELPSNSNIPAQEKMRRHLPEAYQFVYNRYILPPHGIYVIPAKTQYVLVSVQKTIFALDVVPAHLVPAGGKLFNSFKSYSTQQVEYNVPPPTPCRSPFPQEATRVESSKRQSPWGHGYKIPKKSKRSSFIPPPPVFVEPECIPPPPVSPQPQPSPPVSPQPQPSPPASPQPECIPSPTMSPQPECIPSPTVSPQPECIPSPTVSPQLVQYVLVEEEAPLSMPQLIVPSTDAEEACRDFFNNFDQFIAKTPMTQDMDFSFLDDSFDTSASNPSHHGFLNPAPNAPELIAPNVFPPIEILYTDPMQDDPLNCSNKKNQS